MNINTYKISETEYIKINTKCIHEDECQFCAEIDIHYINTKNNLCVNFGNESARDFYYYIVESNIFEKLINGTHTLNASITHDVGFEWNEYFANKRGPTEADQYHWTANDHKKIRPYYSSWLYNDENGNVIFEITPNYPWFYVTKKECPEKISYKEWIKNYKPVVKTIIPKENLKQWIKQADEFGKKYKVKF